MLYVRILSIYNIYIIYMYHWGKETRMKEVHEGGHKEGMFEVCVNEVRVNVSFSSPFVTISCECLKVRWNEDVRMKKIDPICPDSGFKSKCVRLLILFPFFISFLLNFFSTLLHCIPFHTQYISFQSYEHLPPLFQKIIQTISFLLFFLSLFQSFSLPSYSLSLSLSFFFHLFFLICHVFTLSWREANINLYPKNFWLRVKNSILHRSTGCNWEQFEVNSCRISFKKGKGKGKEKKKGKRESKRGKEWCQISRIQTDSTEERSETDTRTGLEKSKEWWCQFQENFILWIQLYIKYT